MRTVGGSAPATARTHSSKRTATVSGGGMAIAGPSANEAAKEPGGTGLPMATDRREEGMNTTEAIFGRRAIRAYTSRKVEEDTLRALLRAAVQAPSAMNRQPWTFSVVQDVGQLKRYSDQAKAALLGDLPRQPKAAKYEDLLRSPGFNIFYDASTLVVIGAAEPGPFTEADCWLAAENLMLAAHDAGLGTCCIGFALAVLNTTEAKAELGLPSSGLSVAPITLGYPANIPPAVPRAEPKILTWSR